MSNVSVRLCKHHGLYWRSPLIFCGCPYNLSSPLSPGNKSSAVNILGWKICEYLRCSNSRCPIVIFKLSFVNLFITVSLITSTYFRMTIMLQMCSNCEILHYTKSCRCGKSVEQSLAASPDSRNSMIWILKNPWQNVAKQTFPNKWIAVQHEAMYHAAIKVREKKARTNTSHLALLVYFQHHTCSVLFVSFSILVVPLHPADLIHQGYKWELLPSENHIQAG